MGLWDCLCRRRINTILAPVAGEVIPVEQVNDPTFSGGLLGTGVAIKPVENKIYAPCDGTVDLMFDTGHAVSMTADFGAEILIHVGLDTVKLKGEYYRVCAASGDRVRAGQLLLEFDRDAIAAAGYDTVTPVVICNSGDFSSIKTYSGRTALHGEKIIVLAK